MLTISCSPSHNAIDDGSSSSYEPPENQPSFFSCSSGDSRLPGVTPLKKLNKYEIENSIEDLFGFYLNAAEVSSIKTQIQPFLDAIPDEEVEKNMDIFDQSVTDVHINAQILLAEKVAEIITGSNNLKSKVMGSCSSNLNNQGCKTNFITNFGKLVYRRPLSPEDINWYLGVLNDHTDGYENALTALLSSPYFIYHYEVGEEYAQNSNSNTVSLDPYERISKLSYFYLQSMPDEALFTAAQDKSIMTSEGVQGQVNRLMAMPKVRTRLTYFLSKQLFKLKKTPEYETSLASLNSMLAELTVTETLENRRQHMIQEVIDYMDHMIWVQKGGFKDLMTSDLVFPRTADLAEIYDSPVWNGNNNSPVRAPAGKRSGLLTRAHFLFTGTQSTRPIMRGVHIYNDYLCGSLPPPADNSSPANSVIEDHFSEKQIVKGITEIPGTSCVGCHKGIINPLGFPMEIYDSFGRWRVTENIYYSEAHANKGNVLTTKPVESEASLSLGSELTFDVTDGVDLVNKISTNRKALACFNSKLWSFTMKSPSKIGENDCAISSLYDVMGSKNSIFEALKEIPLQPEFFKRTVK